MAKSPVYEIAMTLPFTIDDFGNVSNTTSQTKIWADRARSAVGTALGERVFLPEYGTTIPETLFDGVDAMANIIESQVSEVFIRDLPLLTLTSVAVAYNEGAETIFAEIEYELPNKDQASISVGVARINANEPLTEELR